MYAMDERDRDRYVPMLAVHETPSAYEIELDLPFATAGDVDVRAHEHDLLVGCSHSIDQWETSDEPRFGTFVKRIHLARGIDASHVLAQLAAGVLRILAPKLASERDTH